MQVSALVRRSSSRLSGSRYPKSTKRRRSWNSRRRAAGEAADRDNCASRASHRANRRALAARPMPLWPLVALALGALIARRSARRSPSAPPGGRPSSVRFNGFESGGAGDYAWPARHAEPARRSPPRSTPPADLGLETAAGSGANEYVDVARSATRPRPSPTAIWACRRERADRWRAPHSQLDERQRPSSSSCVLEPEQPAADHRQRRFRSAAAQHAVAICPQLLVDASVEYHERTGAAR